MEIQYCFTSPDGDIVLDPDDLQQPFLVAPDKQHPFLTLGDYFSAIERFVCRDNGQLLNRILHEHYPACMPFDRLRKIIVTSEKHGAFYHIARLTLQAESSSCTLAITAAVTKNSRQRLKQEFMQIGGMNEKHNLPFLPQVYCQGHERCKTPAGTTTISFVLGQWFSGFHEWHLSDDPADNSQKIVLWDAQTGNRFLSDSKARELIRQAAAILTLYYDCRTFQQITAWHHAAGDFVVRDRGDGLDVRLITVRGYEPLPGFSPDEGTGGIEIPLVVFSLNLTLQMRLDRLNGVGDLVWLEEFAIEETVRGFFEALAIHEKEGRLATGFTDDFRMLLTTFQPQDFLDIYQQLISADDRSARQEAAFFNKQLPEHCQQLCQTVAAL
jgi:hypothetical protein